MKTEMGRYLIFFSYLGTHYRGMQIQREAGEVIQRIKTVQGVLEEGLRRLGPTNELTVKTSSRTDSNVHALCNTVHVDLVHRHHPWEFNPHWITVRLNKIFQCREERLRILNTIRVPDNFSSRAAASERSYVYRLAVMTKKNYFSEPTSKGLPWGALDEEFCSRVYPPFDMEQFLRAADVLSGTHNFLSFTTKNVLKSGKTHQELQRNTSMRICVKRSSALLAEHRPMHSEDMAHWDVHFTGRSFLYKQIRRMMGALAAVAKGQITIAELQHLLSKPSMLNPGRIQALPAFGLFLKEVRYPAHVYMYNQSEVWQAADQLADNPQMKTGIRECLPPRTDLYVPERNRDGDDQTLQRSAAGVEKDNNEDEEERNGTKGKISPKTFQHTEGKTVENAQAHAATPHPPSDPNRSVLNCRDCENQAASPSQTNDQHWAQTAADVCVEKNSEKQALRDDQRQEQWTRTTDDGVDKDGTVSFEGKQNEQTTHVHVGS